MASYTYTDLYRAWRSVKWRAALYGDDSTLICRERQKLLGALRVAVMEDLGISKPEDAPNPPPETELGEKASAVLSQLLASLNSQL